MQLYVAFFFFFFLAASWVQDGEAYKCSQDVLGRVQEIYTKYNSVPTGILDKNVRLSQDTVVATTDGYFDDQENICNVSTRWTQDPSIAYTSTIVYNDGETTTLSGEPQEDTPGQTKEADKGVTRYHLHGDGLASCFVKCDDSGEEGPAEGLVKVWNDYDQEDLDRCEEDLEYVLGRQLTQTFPNSCS